MLPIENNNIFAIEMYTAFVPFWRKIGGITNDRWQQGRLTLLSLLYWKKKNSSDNGWTLSIDIKNFDWHLAVSICLRTPAIYIERLQWRLVCNNTRDDGLALTIDHNNAIR